MASKSKPVESTGIVTGRRMIDGRPYFADHNGVPMNRLQWLAATEPERRAAADAKKAALVADLKATTQEGDPS